MQRRSRARPEPGRLHRRAAAVLLGVAVALAHGAAAAEDPPLALRPPAADGATLFGYSVAGTASRIAVGAPHAAVDGKPRAGVVHVFDGRSGALLRTLAAPEPTAEELFGFAVAAEDGVLLVGAPGCGVAGLPNAGAAYAFDLEGALLRRLTEPEPRAQDEFGSAVALVAGQALVGSPTTPVAGQASAGAAYLFDPRDGRLRAALHAPHPTAAQNLAQSVGAAGNRPLVGAPNTRRDAADHAGAAYVYTAAGAISGVLLEPEPGAENLFGFAVAGSPASILVGAPHTPASGLAQAGAAYLFDAESGALRRSWREPSPVAGDLFGYAVALAPHRALVAAPHATVAGRARAGAVYAFDDGDGRVVAVLREPRPGDGSEFGIAVAATPAALVGAQRSTAGPTVGAAFAFGLEAPPDARPASPSPSPNAMR